MGCRTPLKPHKLSLLCHFAQTGFPFSDGTRALPCGTAYHPCCVRAGLPFTSRRRKNAGLIFPDVSDWPLYICESCTVRAVLQREIGHFNDLWLLKLERMRTLDVAHNWSLGTTKNYQSKIRTIRTFEGSHFGLSILPTAGPPSPPAARDIPLMWAELDYSVRLLPKRGRLEADRTPVFGSIRQLRSAAS